YLQTIGGAAQVLAAKIKRVVDVKYLHLSETEAMWFFEVEDFPAVVTMDCYGNSLYDKIRNDSQKKLNKLNDGE
ncbi:fumarate hydratase C-terminal domain-containing protein, partial [Patescibacteria group bacterium]|nr:fumarate hydratase C-terminal domain-containing protein [Patescibacteria group bacterium]